MGAGAFAFVGDSIDLGSLPAPFSRLSAAEIEDCLCIIQGRVAQHRANEAVWTSTLSTDLCGQPGLFLRELVNQYSLVTLRASGAPIRGSLSYSADLALQSFCWRTLVLTAQTSAPPATRLPKAGTRCEGNTEHRKTSANPLISARRRRRANWRRRVSRPSCFFAASPCS